MGSSHGVRVKCQGEISHGKVQQTHRERDAIYSISSSPLITEIFALLLAKRCRASA